jgi:tetratricopeptide (TPR) repeat protein
MSATLKLQNGTRQLTIALLLLIASACSTLKTSEESPSTDPVIAIEPAVDEVVEIPNRPFPADSFYDLLVAEFAVRRNRYDLALGNYLQQAHQTRDPGVTARATRMAQFLRADKATMDAAQLWVELEPDNTEANYTTATILAKNSRPVEALSHMKRVLELGGQTNFSAIVASTLKLPLETRQLIEQQIDEMTNQFPDNAQLLISKALLLQQRGEIEAALKQTRQVLTLDENDLHAVVVEARLLQQLKRDDEALIRLDQVVKRNPKNRRLRLQYARILMAQDINLAKQQFEILLTTTPKDPDLLLSLGLISKETKQLADAQNYFQRLLTTGSRSTEAHFYLGQLAEYNQQWQEAIDHYQQIPPGADFFNALNRITSLYVKQGKITTARQHLLGLRQQYPEQAVRLYLLESELLLSSLNTDAALALLDEAMLVHPQQANLLYARAVLHEKNNSLALMEKDLRQIIKQDNDNAIALNTLGYVLANRTDRLAEAYQLITRALSAKPNDPAIMDSLGWVEYRRGNLIESLKLLTDAYAAYPDHEVAAHLGEVLWKLGQEDKAFQVWKQGLKQTPNSPLILEAVQRLTPPQLLKQLPLSDQGKP